MKRNRAVGNEINFLKQQFFTISEKIGMINRFFKIHDDEVTGVSAEYHMKQLLMPRDIQSFNFLWYIILLLGCCAMADHNEISEIADNIHIEQSLSIFIIFAEYEVVVIEMQ